MTFTTPVASMRVLLTLLALSASVFMSGLLAQAPDFHKAPATAAQTKNPLAGQPDAATAGRALYQQNCQACHGTTGQGSGNIPALREGPTQAAPDGSIFWFITQGDLNNGMPAWASLPEQQRWQVVTYLKAMSTTPASAAAAPAPPRNSGHLPDPATTAASKAMPATPPFTDFRYEKPGNSRWIKVSDLPAPFATESASNGSTIVPRPAGAWPIAPAGFTVTLYAEGLNNPRLIRTAPNGDFFLAETGPGEVKVLRGFNKEGKPETTSTFATGLKQSLRHRLLPRRPQSGVGLLRRRKCRRPLSLP